MSLMRMDIDTARACLRRSGLVVFPTDTSYGLGCRALDAAAVERLIYAKGRPDGKPLPVLLPSIEELLRRQLDTPLLALARAFWPGPLTIVIPAFPGLPAAVTADTNMVGVRVSAHPVARALVEFLGEPLVATSANRSGQPAATTPEACDAAGLLRVDGIVDAGAVEGGTSTVVGLVDGDLHLYREGRITEENLRAVWNESRI